MHKISEIEELIKLISKLPGLGPKSAKRIVLKLINSRDELVKPMANTLVQVYKNVARCNFCGSLKSNTTGCNNCENINVKITKLAQGLPVGGEIESLDDGTLFSAFKNRSKLNSSSD